MHKQHNSAQNPGGNGFQKADKPAPDRLSSLHYPDMKAMAWEFANKYMLLPDRVEINLERLSKLVEFPHDESGFPHEEMKHILMKYLVFIGTGKMRGVSIPGEEEEVRPAFTIPTAREKPAKKPAQMKVIEPILEKQAFEAPEIPGPAEKKLEEPKAPGAQEAIPAKPEKSEGLSLGKVEEEHPSPLAGMNSVLGKKMDYAKAEKKFLSLIKSGYIGKRNNDEDASVLEENAASGEKRFASVDLATDISQLLADAPKAREFLEQYCREWQNVFVMYGKREWNGDNELVREAVERVGNTGIHEDYLDIVFRTARNALRTG